MNVRRLINLSGIVALAVLLLGGCRTEEQGRLINYKPGVYKGKADSQLTETQRRALRQRVVQQGAGVTGGGGTPGSRDVRKPPVALDTRALGSRTKMQAGSSTRL